MKHTRLTLVPLAFIISACEPSTLFDVETVVMLEPESGETAVEPDGSIVTTLETEFTGRQLDADGNGYGFVVGLYPDVPGAAGFAGLTEATDLGVQPTTGTATMFGTYRLGRLDNLALNAADRPEGSASSLAENITLTADFETETLTGTQNDLTVNGIMDEGVLSGTVTYDGLDGTLIGAIGETKAVGSFSGSDANTVYAGGFIVEE